MFEKEATNMHQAQGQYSPQCIRRPQRLTGGSGLV